MEMGGGGGGGDQYGVPDLRHFMAGRTHFPVTSQPSENFFVRRPPFEPIMVGEFLPRGLVSYDSTTTSNVTTATPTTASASAACRLDIESGWGGSEGGNSRWPRQETLTLLEIRSRLDSKFKEANQKGPLWDEVSRIMAEEHGYQRSGKKCREKFENLYKYYKKTKEGKAGRHDGKHYRFFRQLEAICGETSSNNNNNNNQTSSASETHLPINPSLSQTPSSKFKQENQEPKLCESLSFSNSSEFETSSSENNEDDLSAIAFMMKQPRNTNLETKPSAVGDCSRRAKKAWKSKVKEFVDSQMSKLVETQEAWMERTLKAIEDREQERLRKEEQWRKQEEARFSREHEFWAKERAWVEARDVALMEALKKFTGKNLQDLSSMDGENHHNGHNKNPETNSDEICINETITNNGWTEPEFSTLLQLRASADLRYQEEGYMKEGIWEEIAGKMASYGYDRSAFECKEKWENMNMYFNMASSIESNKKRREDLRTSNYFDQTEFYNGPGVPKQKNDNNNMRFGSSSHQVHHENSFQVIMNEGGNWWGECDLNLSKEKNQHD